MSSHQASRTATLLLVGAVLVLSIVGLADALATALLGAPEAEASSEPVGGGPATEAAVYGNAAGLGVAGVTGFSGSVFGIKGESNTGWGGYFHSDDGYGIRVNTDGTAHYDHGALITANSGFGVLAQSAANQAVRGEAGSVAGISQPLGAVGIVGLGANRGAYGASDSGVGVYGTSETNYAGYFYSDGYRGSYHSSASGYYAGYFTNRAGSTQPGIYVNGTMTVTGSKSGYVVDVARNDGPHPLQTGDVVVITGSAEPLLGEIPVPTVRLADGVTASGVMGVVDQMFATPQDVAAIPESLLEGWRDLRSSLTRDDLSVDRAQFAADNIVPASDPANRPLLGPESPGRFVGQAEADFLAQAMGRGPGIAPGAYVGVVTLGAFKAIRVDASYGPIAPGDLLVASPTPGHAMWTADPEPGTVIGKALGGLGRGQGTVPVLITLN